MEYQNYTVDELINEVKKFKDMSSDNIQKYNETHKISVNKRLQELEDILAEKVNIENNQSYIQNAIEICNSLGINFNADKEYVGENKSTNSDEYKVITIALAKGILKNSFDGEKIQNNLYKKGLIKNTNLTKRDINIKVVRAIILDIIGLTPEQYYSIYSTKINRTLHIYPYAKEIIDSCSAEEKDAYGVDNKDIFFVLCFPEFAKDRIDMGKKTTHDFLYCKGGFKSGLIKASKCNKIIIDKITSFEEFEDLVFKMKNSKSGDLVDRRIFDALNDAFAASNYEDKAKILTMIANYKKFFSDCNTEIAGFVDVVNARGCYQTPLDFYYANLSKDDRLDLFDTYYSLKEELGQITPALELMKEFIDENRNEINETMTLDDI